MSSPASGPNGSGHVDPRLSLVSTAQSTQQTTDPTTGAVPSTSQEEEDLFAFPVGSGGSPMNFDNLQAAADTALMPPPPVPTTNTAETPPYLFGPYARHLPGFDLDAIADGLYERDRTFPPPPNDDVDKIIADPEAYVKRVREAISSKPENPTAQEADMANNFVTKMLRIETRDIDVTQVSAEIVRLVIRLHEPRSQGASAEDGMVEGDDGEIVEGRVDVPEQPDVIGDHFRPDQIEVLAPTQLDFELTATARIETICNMLRQTKDVAFNVFCGRDPIAQLIAAPNKVHVGMLEQGGSQASMIDWLV